MKEATVTFTADITMILRDEAVIPKWEWMMLNKTDIARETIANLICKHLGVDDAAVRDVKIFVSGGEAPTTEDL